MDGMQEIEKRLESLKAEFAKVYERLKIAEKVERLKKLEEEVAEPEIWRDVKVATEKNQELASLSDEVQPWVMLETQINDMGELIAMADDSLTAEMDGQLTAMESELDGLKKALRFTGPYDGSDAILRITSGAGGTEAMDWASMLYRMYVRWAERRGFKVTVLDYQDGEEAGMKSCSLQIEGPMAYGYLKAENGVHRLVRISPFDSNARRHTSFASVEVMPEFEDDLDIEIDEKDLETITMRSSGAGGQHINKTDSAVRMTYKPLNITVFCQTQRSQLQNREACLNMLKSKLLQIRIQEQAKKMAEIKGEVKANEWGSQIRSYVFQPYTMVKDLRTGHEVGNIQGVMDGDLDDFIYSYLRSQIS